MYVFTDDDFQQIIDQQTDLRDIILKIMVWIEDRETIEHEANE